MLLAKFYLALRMLLLVKITQDINFSKSENIIRNWAIAIKIYTNDLQI